MIAAAASRISHFKGPEEWHTMVTPPFGPPVGKPDLKTRVA
jgi:hypothetical protein